MTWRAIWWLLAFEAGAVLSTCSSLGGQQMHPVFWNRSELQIVELYAASEYALGEDLLYGQPPLRSGEKRKIDVDGITAIGNESHPCIVSAVAKFSDGTWTELKKQNLCRGGAVTFW